MIKYPVLFKTEVQSISGIGSTWQTTSDDIKSVCAIPTSFEGPGGGLSPEDLYAQALTNCLVATFKVYAEKSKVRFDQVHVKTDLIVDLNDEKKPVMKKAILEVQVTGAENPDRTKSLVERAFQSGFILNSVKTELELKVQVS